MSLQATRNANQLMISLRYAINAGDTDRMHAAVDRVNNLELERLDEQVKDELFELCDEALSILNIN